MMNTKAQHLLNHYATQLDQFFAVHQDADTTLSDWLASHFSTAQMMQLLQCILADQDSVAQIAARSYQHGNGFLKVVLLDRGYKLRLHIWFAGQACEENIHDHRWSFSSLILAGELKSEIWQDDQSGQAFHEYEYHAATVQQAPYKRDLGLQNLSLDHVQVNTVGEHYVMPKGKLHRIINPGHQMVATMMCSAPTEQGTTRLIPIHAGIDPNIQPPKTNAQHLAGALIEPFYIICNHRRCKMLLKTDLIYQLLEKNRIKEINAQHAKQRQQQELMSLKQLQQRQPTYLNDYDQVFRYVALWLLQQGYDLTNHEPHQVLKNICLFHRPYVDVEGLI